MAYNKPRDPARVSDDDYEYIFLNTNHMTDIEKVLEHAGMIENTGYKVWSGYCVYPVVRWLR